MESPDSSGTKVFISYRRNDSEGVAGRLFDRLVARFGREQIFMDVDSIAPGEDFIEVIERAVTSCDVLIAIIGRDWLEARDQDGQRRMDNPEDFVRVEIAAALDRDILVIPVLVGGATMPRSSDLPDPLRKLARRNALDLNHARWWHDSSRLISTIEQRLAARGAPDLDRSASGSRSSQGFAEPDQGPSLASPKDSVSSSTINMNAPKNHEPEDHLGERSLRSRGGAPNITPPLVSRPVNLGFDGAVEMGFPHGWFNGEYFVSNVSTRYRAHVQPSSEGHGACLAYENMEATSEEFGVVMQRFPAQFLGGKAVRLEADLATDDVAQWAGLWLRGDGKGAPNLFFDNMERNPIQATTGWARYKLDGQLPHEIAWLNYGIVIVGPGRIWADNFRLLVWTGLSWDDV